MDRLLKSAKFWTAAIDLLVSLLVYFVTKYASPSAVDDVKFVLLTVQPVIALVIAAWAHEDAEKAKMAAHVEIARINRPLPGPQA